MTGKVVIILMWAISLGIAGHIWWEVNFGDDYR